jgi:hypothetical protein
MSDPTESIRRELVAVINASPQSREGLEAWYGQVWDTAELARDSRSWDFAGISTIWSPSFVAVFWSRSTCWQRYRSS